MKTKEPTKNTASEAWKAPVAGIAELFRIVQWAMAVGFLRYLGEHFNLPLVTASTLLLSALLLAYLGMSGACVARRRSHLAIHAIALSALFVSLGFLLIACAWEVASLVSTLQASVVI